MSYKVLLPQPILPEGYAYLLDRGYQVVDGRGFAEEDIAPPKSPARFWTPPPS